MKILITLLCAASLGVSTLSKETNAPAPAEEKIISNFQFDGGQLKDFVKSVYQTFGVNLEQIATVPDGMLYSVRVPKMRRNVEAPYQRARNERLFLRDILLLYNNISEKGDPSMGRWIMEPQGGEPQTILLVSTGPRPESPFAVRAFSFPWGAQDSEKIVEILQQTVMTQRDILRASGNVVGLSDSDIRCGLDYHKEAGILVASGGKVYVEMAASIIEAYKEKLIRLPMANKPNFERP